MPPPKKAAKKTPAKSAPKHDEGKDLRRAYEHKGRVLVLRPLLGKNTSDVDALVQLAERELAGSYGKDAADLFRAAEHLSFGYLASTDAEEHANDNLAESTESEFENKLAKANEHWKKSDALGSLYEKTTEGAQKAFDDGAYRKALELVRAAEAIAHVHLHEAEQSSTE